MIDNNTNLTTPPQHINGNQNTDSAQAERGRGTQSPKGQAFESTTRKNPGHDGCNVSQKDIDKAQAVDTENSSNQNGGTEKTAGGNCPGSNIIASLLQDLAAALQDVQLGSNNNR